MTHAPEAPPPWTPPVPFHRAHIPLVRHAWSVVSVDGEEQVKRWRVMIQNAFVQWRDRHGTAPTDDAGPGALGLLGNPYIGRPVQECPPYVCAGPKVENYFDLLMMLVDDNDPGVAALIARITLYKALAVLVLAEVHDHPSGALEAAYAALRDIEATDQRRREAILLKAGEKLVPLAETGRAFKRGNPNKGGSKSSLQHMVALVCDRIGSTDYDEVWRFFADVADLLTVFRST